MSEWFGWWRFPAAPKRPEGGFEAQYQQEPKLPPPGMRMDPQTGAYVPVKRDYTVARSTRAMPERRKP